MNSPWIFAIIAVSQILWLWTLLSHLSDKNCDPTDKICWTVVLCTLNVLGMILYLLGGPKVGDESQQGKDGALSEEELKRAFNEGRR